jgi:Capsule assembly protein Wzi
MRLRKNREYARRIAIAAVFLCAAHPVPAGPLVPVGDPALRADIQLLADHGIVEGPVTSWPLAWAPILADLESTDLDTALPAHVTDALVRVRETARRQTGVDDVRYTARLSAADDPLRIRSFADAPRESGEIGAGVSWTNDRLAVDLHAQFVSSPDDGNEWRADGSLAGVAVGNFVVAASTLDRWWGPGWDGSLILSNNARPIPALTIDRTFTNGFEWPVLRWLGPWDLSVIFGRMESERTVPDAQFFGLRFNFRPLTGLEIGVSRTAQWCGEGRPCDFGTFADLLAGRDNRGDDGIEVASEPGNQLAGIDFRGSLARWSLPVAVYGQFIGEDEAGGFPSRFLAQLGAEASGHWGDRWSWRWFGEVAETSCGFYESDGEFNCAYNHGIYRDGYRYYGRPIGHGADNDARLLSVGLLLMDDAGTRWNLRARYGDLNRGGAPDARNSLTPVPEDLASLDLSWSRDFRFGVIEVGAGAERTGETDFRGYFQWRSSR